MRRTVVRTAAIALAAFVLLPAGAHAASPPVTTPVTTPAGTHCTPAVHSWAGRVALGPGEIFHTGVVVAPQTGVQETVVASDTSTDSPAPGALSLAIGDVPVADGAAVAGGEITVANLGTIGVVLTRVEISVDACIQVAVAPPLPSVTAMPTDSLDLPATGAVASGSVATVAVCVALSGCALLLLLRRRSSTASVRGR